jgi:multiple sugar transport system substrate-binding protein
MWGVQRLTGITWNHTHGFLPMVATAQRFAEIHPGVEIVWQKRSLQAFGDQPLEQLVPQFDLLVIDHPFVSYAAANPVILALDEYLPAEFLADQAANSVGKSYESYCYGDAGERVAPGLAGAPARDLGDLLALARRGMVVLPAIPIDSLMNFYMR